MKNSLISYLKQKVWGTSPSYASSKTPMDQILEVYLQSTNERGDAYVVNYEDYH